MKVILSNGLLIFASRDNQKTSGNRPGENRYCFYEDRHNWIKWYSMLVAIGRYYPLRTYTTDRYHHGWYRNQRLNESLIIFLIISRDVSYGINSRDHRKPRDTLDTPSACSMYRSPCMYMREHAVLCPCRPVNLDRSHRATWTERRIPPGCRRRSKPDVGKHRSRQREVSIASSRDERERERCACHLWRWMWIIYLSLILDYGDLHARRWTELLSNTWISNSDGATVNQQADS